MQGKDRTTHTMRILTNRYQDCELLNLGTNKNGHWTLSYPPGWHSTALPRKKITFYSVRRYLGSQHNCVYTPGKGARAAVIFQNAAELYATVQELGRNPVVEAALPPGKSREELNAAIETTISRVWSQMKEARAKRLTMPGA